MTDSLQQPQPEDDPQNKPSSSLPDQSAKPLEEEVAPPSARLYVKPRISRHGNLRMLTQLE